MFIKFYWNSTKHTHLPLWLLSLYNVRIAVAEETVWPTKPKNT